MMLESLGSRAIQRGGGGAKGAICPGPQDLGAPKNIMEKNKRYYEKILSNSC